LAKPWPRKGELKTRMRMKTRIGTTATTATTKTVTTTTTTGWSRQRC